MSLFVLFGKLNKYNRTFSGTEFISNHRRKMKTEPQAKVIVFPKNNSNVLREKYALRIKNITIIIKFQKGFHQFVDET